MRMWQVTLSALMLFTQCVQAQWQGNWLVGASGIYVQRRGELDLSLRYSPVINFPRSFPNLEAQNRYTNKGFGAGVLAGYQVKSQGWTWGLEGSVDWHDADTPRDVVFTDVAGLFSWDAQSTYERDAIYAISGRMAYEMAPYFIPYIRLGVEGSDDSLDLTLISSTPLISPNPITVSDSRWNWHYLAGVGVETPLWDTAMTLRLEYIYHSRASSLKPQGSLGLGLLNPAFTFVSDMHNRTQSFKLSAVWNFS
ncbi:MAG: outer membrane beta-barrel protein [Proteobacteria bacterium]|nr:outer membrane beta-barrel protein [Pseudomonadota bacterium]